MTVAADEARNERGSPQDISHWADVEAGQALVAGRFIQHGHSSSLHDTIRGQINCLKRAEIIELKLGAQGYLLVRTAVH